MEVERSAAQTLLAFIEACCKKADQHIDNRNFGWAEFTMARAQQAADAYLTLAKAGAGVDASE